MQGGSITLLLFWMKQVEAVVECSEMLVRQLIEKIRVYDETRTAGFKSVWKTDVET